MLVPPSNVDVPQARCFLIEHLGDDVSEVEYVGEGAWSRCFGYVRRGRQFVIRFGGHVKDFQRDRFASRFASVDLSIPEVTEIGEAFGAWYAISTRARGTPWEHLGHAEWTATIPAILATLDALRQVDISATTGYGRWDGDGVAPHAGWAEYLAVVAKDPPGRRTHGWRKRLIDSPVGEAGFRRGYARMLELSEAFPGPRSLVHNDLLNRNALAAEGRVTAVFDWGCSIYGDFVYELATLVFWSPWHAAIDASAMLSRAVAHHAEIGLDVPDFEPRLRCCALHIGLEHLAYNAFLGDLDTLRRTDERMTCFLESGTS